MRECPKGCHVFVEPFHPFFLTLSLQPVYSSCSNKGVCLDNVPGGRHVKPEALCLKLKGLSKRLEDLKNRLKGRSDLPVTFSDVLVTFSDVLGDLRILSVALCNASNASSDQVAPRKNVS